MLVLEFVLKFTQHEKMIPSYETFLEEIITLE